MTKYCFTLDLKSDPELISAYDEWHKQVWPEIIDSIKAAGVDKVEIYRYDNRLMMIMEVNESFSPERKAAMDAANERVQEWENLMWKYQQALPGAMPGAKWVMMNKIFEI
jgi:L-rhamnose mutarotase